MDWLDQMDTLNYLWQLLEVTVRPATVQTAPVLLVKLTAIPDEALAVRLTLLPRVRSAG